MFGALGPKSEKCPQNGREAPGVEKVQNRVQNELRLNLSFPFRHFPDSVLNFLGTSGPGAKSRRISCQEGSHLIV